MMHAWADYLDSLRTRSNIVPIRDAWFCDTAKPAADHGGQWGGRLLGTDLSDPDECKLRNVVEEMVIAAGVPTPKIYVLDGDGGINAFAAGHAPSDAASGITRGAMSPLNRDELQGVIGHEFSHILKGDTRLNIRMMGALFGIVCLAVIVRVLLYSRGRRGRKPMMFLGLALIVIGALGITFGRLIQAALSRQRELLADASAVQFTREPAGLSSALQKIGSVGSKIESAHAAEASHMFFENGLGKPVLGMMATNPPLEQRIRAIDPAWDGKFSPVRDSAVTPWIPRSAGPRKNRQQSRFTSTWSRPNSAYRQSTDLMCATEL